MIGMLREVLADCRRERNAKIAINIDFANRHFRGFAKFRFGNTDGVGHAAAVLIYDCHFILRNAGRAVQHDGETGQTFAYFFENIKAKLGILSRFEFICAVRRADSDGKRIDAGAGSKFFHFVRRSEKRVVGGNVNVVFNACEFAEFGFHHYAVVVRVFHHFFGDGDIFFPRLGRSVDHDGSEAAVDRSFADIEIRAVIKVHNDGNICSFHRRSHKVL